MDAARIQAQAEMVIMLMEALQSAVIRQSEPYMLAMRFVETLRWMSYNPYTREFMPPEAMRTLGQLQDFIEAGKPGEQRKAG
jgi:hypothetical protein